jgi:hypothetical protein
VIGPRSGTAWVEDTRSATWIAAGIVVPVAQNAGTTARSAVSQAFARMAPLPEDCPDGYVTIATAFVDLEQAALMRVPQVSLRPARFLALPVVDSTNRNRNDRDSDPNRADYQKGALHRTSNEPGEKATHARQHRCVPAHHSHPSNVPRLSCADHAEVSEGPQAGEHPNSPSGTFRLFD